MPISATSSLRVLRRKIGKNNSLLIFHTELVRGLIDVMIYTRRRTILGSPGQDLISTFSGEPKHSLDSEGSS